MKKTEGIIKKIGKGLLLGIMTLSFAMPLFACGHKENNNPVVDPTPPIVDVDPEEKDPQEPVTPPVDDDKEEQQKQQKLDAAATELNNLISDLGRNFTYTDNQNQKVEVDENKVKLTIDGEEEFIEETQEGNYNYYTGTDNKIHRKIEENDTIDKIVKAIKTNFCDIKWDSLDGKTLKGKKNLVTISCTLNNDAINFVSLNDTFTIDKKGKTEVQIPVEYIDDNFKVEENIETLLTNLDKVIRAACTILSSDKFYVDNLYLKKGSNIVDTVGVVLHRERENGDDYGFCIGEAQLSGLTEDLTYQSICENGLPTGFKVQHINTIKNYNLVSSLKTTYQKSIDTLFNQLIGANSRDDAQWWGYNIDTGVDADTHTIYLFKDNKIYEKEATVYHEAKLGIVNQAVEQNFKDKPQSSSTWKLDKNQVYDIPEDSIDVYQIQQQQQKPQETEI